MRQGLILWAAMLVGAPGLAESPPPKPAKPREICHIEPVTGSHFTKTICHTSEEWDALEAAANQLVKDTLKNAAVDSGRGFDPASQMGLRPQ